MTLNELFIKQNFLQPIVFRNEESKETLSKELKAKIMMMRIAMSKHRKQFDEDVQEAATQLKTPEFIALSEKERNESEEAEFQTILASLNEEHQTFIQQRLEQEVDFDKTFTEDEYYSIMDINTSDVTINQNELKNADFLEVFYTLFVE